MAANDESILADVAGYYASTLALHGETARGVDWNGEESQRLRFEQLARIVDVPAGFSVNDLGCGYGALYDFLRDGWSDFSYTGCDVAAEMIDAAARRLPKETAGIRLVVASEPPGVADFGIASGIFNVRMGRDNAQWEEYLLATLDTLDRTSRRGFAFNCLTSYSDPDKMRDHLFYADPCRLFDFCKRRYSRQVALLHDYGLYEFTMLVRKPQ
ncbi:class I SAM-dependent methyltransferase [Caenimonas soli]|uniref:class I SAM-dependent methyltransferase n=1 Tax=Caenimonas soli TaxID=2735555 RepID=UPI001552885C|nr:class I SAM-dependent methyltransferase [Caenimonas soli]NPC55773.1 methyltransferase domain-containing protein [Caenimonas soli]